jgi:hypothetical protein
LRTTRRKCSSVESIPHFGVGQAGRGKLHDPPRRCAADMRAEGTAPSIASRVCCCVAAHGRHGWLPPSAACQQAASGWAGAREGRDARRAGTRAGGDARSAAQHDPVMTRTELRRLRLMRGWRVRLRLGGGSAGGCSCRAVLLARAGRLRRAQRAHFGARMHILLNYVNISRRYTAYLWRHAQEEASSFRTGENRDGAEWRGCLRRARKRSRD